MTAAENTRRMLTWWAVAGVERADVAIRRRDGTMVWHTSLSLASLHLSWAGAENAREADVYIRPARGRSWRLVFLDDVDLPLARRVVDKYAALAVQTSIQGGCHIWLGTTVALDEIQRAQAQRWLAHRIAADPASTSGEHLGRLAGFRNWKRGGNWVNVAAASTDRPTWDPAPALREAAQPHPGPRMAGDHTPATLLSDRDHSPSGRDWAWLCRALESGADPASLHDKLVSRVEPRRGPDALRYATHTIQQAVRHVASKGSTTAPPWG